VDKPLDHDDDDDDLRLYFSSGLLYDYWGFRERMLSTKPTVTLESHASE
jgi:hypothetical protein